MQLGAGMHIPLLLLALAAAAATASTGRSAVSPVQKVIQMLSGMLTRGREEKQQEQVQYAAYKQFCDDVTQEKTRAVEKAAEQVNLLEANIQLATTAASDLMREVTKHDEDVAVWQGDLKAAAVVRKKESADYVTVHKDYSETVDAIQQAVQVLTAEAAKGPREQVPDGLLQLTRPGAFNRIPAGAKQELSAFLNTRADPVSGPEAEAYAYEFRSTSVVDMLNQLRDKFVEERTQLEKEELNKRHGHELFAMDLQKSIANAQDARGMKSQERAKSLQSVAEMKGQLMDTRSAKEDDAKYLADMTATCRKKASDFTERQNLRGEELKAIETAISILSSDKVQMHSDTYLSALQRGRSQRNPMLLQIGGEAPVPNKLRVAAYLNDQAAALGNQALAMLALRVRADPFEKVRKMIQDLISRLQEEAGQEAQHNHWCIGELADNEKVRTSRTTAVERLMSEIDGKRSAIAKLGMEIADLSSQLSESETAIAEATTLRHKEKQANEQTIRDAQEAQTALGQAVTVLREFYATAGEATALLQGRGRGGGERKEDPEVVTPPPIFNSPYTGMGVENGGVLSMLEVIQSDFARLESETEAAEAVALAEYNTQMTEGAVLKAEMQKDIEHKTSLKQTAQQALVDLNNDLLISQKELEAATRYYDKLKPSCVNPGMTTEERAHRRREEIESLQEALRILDGEDLA